MDLQEIVCRLIEPDETPKYLVGTNSFAETAFHHLEKSNVTIKGFINLNTNQKTFCHTPVIHRLSQVLTKIVGMSMMPFTGCLQMRNPKRFFLTS